MKTESTELAQNPPFCKTDVSGSGFSAFRSPKLNNKKMKVSELITELQKFPTDTEVCITDWRKHIHHADDEPQGHGIEPKFKVEFVNEDVSIPFIALSFENDDYKDDGTPDEGSSIYSSIERGLS